MRVEEIVVVEDGSSVRFKLKEREEFNRRDPMVDMKKLMKIREEYSKGEELINYRASIDETLRKINEIFTYRYYIDESIGRLDELFTGEHTRIFEFIEIDTGFEKPKYLSIDDLNRMYEQRIVGRTQDIKEVEILENEHGGLVHRLSLKD